jgi:peptidoglycan hydrolase-like protein with peptidoglycan-binding domain
MGSTGTATGAHLHWGIKKSNKWVDPKPYLDKDYPVTTVTKKEELTVNIEMTVLTKGSKGEQVKTLQRLLMAMGYNLGGYGADGSFGNATDSAVRAFQKAKGLAQDGSVGQATWNKILKG